MFLKHILDLAFYDYFNTYMAGITKDIAILRLSVTGGGHLEFSHENVDEKNGNSFCSVL